MKKTIEYAEIIMNDEREKIVAETPTVYEEDKIERIYEFADGAIVKYEWQSTPDGNHRFTLLILPKSNPHNFKKGIIKEINYPRN
jgi:hypothetical protein